MKTRRIKIWKDISGQEHRDIVWFGSYGLKGDFEIDFRLAEPGTELSTNVVKSISINNNKLENSTNAVIGANTTGSSTYSLFGCKLSKLGLLLRYQVFNSTSTAGIKFSFFTPYESRYIDYVEIHAIRNVDATTKTSSLSVSWRGRTTSGTFNDGGHEKTVTSTNAATPTILKFSSPKQTNYVSCDTFALTANYLETVYILKMKVVFKNDEEANAAKFYNDNNIHDNYATEQQSVIDGLIQRLSVIKGELWYKINEGVPLFDKYRSKGIMDAELLSIISSHPDIISISNFESTLNNHSYSCKFRAISVYGELEISI